MDTFPLVFFGDNAPQQPSQLFGTAAHSVKPFMFRTLRSILADLGAHLLHGVLFVVMPFQGKGESEPPSHMAQSVALLRRAAEFDKTDPEAAAKLRWLASTYCCV